MSFHEPDGSGKRPRRASPNRDDIYDAAWNAVAVASTHWQQSTGALRHVLACGQQHGLSMVELSAASGLDYELIGRLLDEAA